MFARKLTVGRGRTSERAPSSGPTARTSSNATDSDASASVTASLCAATRARVGRRVADAIRRGVGVVREVDRTRLGADAAGTPLPERAPVGAQGGPRHDLRRQRPVRARAIAEEREGRAERRRRGRRVLLLLRAAAAALTLTALLRRPPGGRHRNRRPGARAPLDEDRDEEPPGRGRYRNHRRGRGAAHRPRRDAVRAPRDARRGHRPKPRARSNRRAEVALERGARQPRRHRGHPRDAPVADRRALERRRRGRTEAPGADEREVAPALVARDLRRRAAIGQPQSRTAEPPRAAPPVLPVAAAVPRERIDPDRRRGGRLEVQRHARARGFERRSDVREETLEREPGRDPDAVGENLADVHRAHVERKLLLHRIRRGIRLRGVRLRTPRDDRGRADAPAGGIALDGARVREVHARKRAPKASAVARRRRRLASAPGAESTLPTSTPASRDRSRLPCPGSQNHIRTPSPRAGRGAAPLEDASPRFSSSPTPPLSGTRSVSAALSSSRAAFSAFSAFSAALIGSTRIAPPCHAPPPLATRLDWPMMVAAASLSAASWHT